MRLIFLSSLYGVLSGAVTALCLWAMKNLQSLLWADLRDPWQIGAVIVTGGTLIALVRHWLPAGSVQQLLHEVQDPIEHQSRWVLAVILTAVLAVAFGGAVGPEAGLIAVVLELSTLTALRLSRDRAQQRQLVEVAVTASLSAWYGSPPAAAQAIRVEDPAPKPLLWWAGFMGLLGFGMTAQHVLGGGLHPLVLPEHKPAGDGSDILWALVPALLGVAIGLTFAWLQPRFRQALAHLGHPITQTMAGTIAFACMAAAWPTLRFSGHHELAELTDWFASSGPWSMLALAVLKVMALCLCQASGWLGGAIFPMLMAGGCAGLASLGLWPDIPAAVALGAGMSAAASVGIGKPALVVLIVVFFAGTPTWPAACMGGLLAYLALRRWPHLNSHPHTV